MTAERREQPPVEPPARTFRHHKVRFLLGTDQHIHRETRVGLVPRQLVRLRTDLEALGLGIDLLVVAGAGTRAGFADDVYAEVGAEIVAEADLPALPSVDVVHALKEPTMYESGLAGPFLRIGAVHLASRPPGVCALVHQRNFGAIIDGGTVGSYAHWLTGGDRTPIVGSMSRFAGWVAAEKLVAGVQANGIERGKVVVVGGGIAGRSAIEKVLPLADQLIVVERFAALHQSLAADLERLEVGPFQIVEAIDDDTLRDAVGVVFAHRSGALAAEKVCTLDQIRTMRPGAGIADIAIDQCGSILHPDYDENDDAVTSRDKTKALLEPDFFYYAEVNMPREEPRDASEVHGDAILPYLSVLLQLCALEGSPAGALEALRALPIRRPVAASEVVGRSRFDCLVQDLRNGLQLAVVDGQVEVVDPDLRAETGLMQWIEGCIEAD